MSRQRKKPEDYTSDPEVLIDEIQASLNCSDLEHRYDHHDDLTFYRGELSMIADALRAYKRKSK